MSHCMRAAYQYRAELAVITAAIYCAFALPQDSRSAGTATPVADQGRRDYERREETCNGRGKASASDGGVGADPSRLRPCTTTAANSKRAADQDDESRQRG